AQSPAEGNATLGGDGSRLRADADTTVQGYRAGRPERTLVDHSGQPETQGVGTVEIAVAEPRGELLAAVEDRRLQGEGNADAVRELAVAPAERIDLSLEGAAVRGKVAEAVGGHHLERSGLRGLARVRGDA